MSLRLTSFLRLAAGTFVFCCCLLPSIASADGAARQKGGFDRFIVMFKPDSSPRRDANARQRALDAGAQGAAARLHWQFRMAQGAEVVRSDRKLTFTAAQALMNRLRRDPAVQYVELDRSIHAAMVPTDPYYYLQWNLTDYTAGINAQPAWDMATGNGSIVAVIDTGRTAHSDVLYQPGYDFISDITRAADGNGRDAVADDPGDRAAADECGAGEEASDSSWHGTQVAGLLGARTNNLKGIAGVAYQSALVPVRVLGKCGGVVSDAADAIRWSAGGTVPGVPANALPAKIINLSLGGEGVCGPTLQAAIDDAVARGAVVVVASGNEGSAAANFFPANCNNVVTVGASSRLGAREPYSNFGPELDVSAPGGGNQGFIPTTYNAGTTTPGAEAYVYTAGTSMATPQVAGVAALMREAGATTPAAIEALLRATARQAPVACPEGCGAGIVNAAAAVGAAKGGRLWVEDSIAFEDDGHTGLVFTVHLSQPMPGPVSFNVATTAGTATASDFAALSWTNQVIPAGATSKQFLVPIVNDTVPEGDENFTFAVANVSGAAVADGSALGVIRNDDAIALTNNVYRKIGDPMPQTNDAFTIEAGREALFSVDVPAGVAELKVDTRSLIAVNANDIDLLVKFEGRPSFASADCISATSVGEETCTIANPAAGRYYIVVYGFEAAFNHGVRATYANPPGLPTLTVRNGSAFEGDVFQNLVIFPFELSWAATEEVHFDIVIRPGTATPGRDYAAQSGGTVSYSAGLTTGNLMIETIADVLPEPNETFTIDIINPQGVIIGTPTVQGRIMNDDLAQVRIGDATVVEGNEGERTLVFPVTLSAPMPNPVWITLQTADGTATAGSDYVARAAENRFIDAGRTRFLYEVQVKGDTQAEANETVNVSVSHVIGAELADGDAVGSIENDDGTPVAPARAARASRVVVLAPTATTKPLDACRALSAVPASRARPASRSSARPASPARSTRCPAAPASPRPARSRPAGKS